MVKKFLEEQITPFQFLFESDSRDKFFYFTFQGKEDTPESITVRFIDLTLEAADFEIEEAELDSVVLNERRTCEIA